MKQKQFSVVCLKSARAHGRAFYTSSPETVAFPKGVQLTQIIIVDFRLLFSRQNLVRATAQTQFPAATEVAVTGFAGFIFYH